MLSTYKFYLKELFQKSYAENMPKWLKKAYKQEIDLILNQVDLYRDSYGYRCNILDVGCGNLRIAKSILKELTVDCPNTMDIKATDIFKPEHLTTKFHNTLLDKNIQYIPLEKYNKLYYLPNFRILFDIIVFFGVDAIISDAQIKSYVEQSAWNLKQKGILIWQCNRNDTELGKKLQAQDSKLNYKYRNPEFYFDLGAKTMLETDISRIFIWQ